MNWKKITSVLLPVSVVLPTIMLALYVPISDVTISLKEDDTSIYIVIDNPTPFTYRLIKLDSIITVGGLEVATITLPYPVDAPPGQTVRVPATIDFKAENAIIASITSILSGPEAPKPMYTLLLEIAPKLGPITLPALEKHNPFKIIEEHHNNEIIAIPLTITTTTDTETHPITLPVPEIFEEAHNNETIAIPLTITTTTTTTGACQITLPTFEKHDTFKIIEEHHNNEIIAIPLTITTTTDTETHPITLPVPEIFEEAHNNETIAIIPQPYYGDNASLTASTLLDLTFTVAGSSG